MSIINVTAESVPSSVLEGVSESAILRSGDYLSYYDKNGSYSRENHFNLVSSNGKYSLKLNGNGGGFISVQSSDGTAWISRFTDLCFLCFLPRDIFIMEESGNLVLYKQSRNIYDESRNIISHNTRTLLWQSNTTGKGNFLILKDDGVLVIYDKNNQQIWSSHTNNSS